MIQYLRVATPHDPTSQMPFHKKVQVETKEMWRYIMKKFLILFLLLIVCGTAYAEPGENISVLVIADSSFNQNAEMFGSIQKAISDKFPKQRYDVKIVNKDSASAISDFMERYNNNKDVKLVTKANAVAYGKDLGAAKVITIRFNPLEALQWYNGMGGNWIRCKVELEIKGFSVAEEKYIADKTFTTLSKERPQKGLEEVLVELKKWQIPIELH
jgi:hypothetical protein